MKKNFVVAVITIEIILGISFISISNTNVQFSDVKKFTKKNYTVAKALANTKQVEFVSRREFRWQLKRKKTKLL